MGFLRITSPHGHGPLSTSKVMQTVLLATLPGVIAMTWFLDPARFSISSSVGLLPWGSSTA